MLIRLAMNLIDKLSITGIPDHPYLLPVEIHSQIVFDERRNAF